MYIHTRDIEYVLASRLPARASIYTGDTERYVMPDLMSTTTTRHANLIPRSFSYQSASSTHHNIYTHIHIIFYLRAFVLIYNVL